MTISSDTTALSESCPRDRLDRYYGICEEFKTMTLQEELAAYKCADYLGAPVVVRNTCADDTLDPIDIECRVRMVEWCFQVIDFAELNRETVNIAMSLLDRYLSTSNPEVEIVKLSRQMYQLASMTALFIAIKMNEKTVVNASLFAELSRGSYTAADITNMESSMLATLQWRLNAPTSHSFLRYLVNLVSNDDTSHFAMESSFLELCVFQLDLSVGDYFFCTKKPSTVAVASFLNAVENSTELSHAGCSNVINTLQSIYGTAIYSNEICSTMSRLTMLLKSNGVETKQTNMLNLPFTRRMSPVSVAGIARVVSEATMVSHHEQ
eukprot:CAMPEP_0176497768 /NCGR_PEP_ID=MMETSP0200_2-20121128/11917_1 /TAXON_ID=947934 /ORGANISM="Chaetoceros sp., Strain GSL56" /LENGTH=322 /DNA_ID=CAMNT_0017895837 /DNA_START=46 /DNA_END=1014 /DNA_ORIENTATION=-